MNTFKKHNYVLKQSKNNCLNLNRPQGKRKVNLQNNKFIEILAMLITKAYIDMKIIYNSY
jgi:hypothetical protein